MRVVQVTQEIDAPSEIVWGVLADFPNIADWNGGVKKSFNTDGQTEGLGATRHCDLKPAGSVKETVREWDAGKKLVVSIDSAKRLPLKSGLATFDLDSGDDATTTRVDVTYEYEPRWAVLDKVFGGVLDKQFTKGFTGFLSDLDTEAMSRKG